MTSAVVCGGAWRCAAVCVFTLATWGPITIALAITYHRPRLSPPSPITAFAYHRRRVTTSAGQGPGRP